MNEPENRISATEPRSTKKHPPCPACGGHHVEINWGELMQFSGDLPAVVLVFAVCPSCGWHGTRWLDEEAPDE